MSKFSATDTLELPVAERLALVEEIWDTIATAPEALPLTDEDKRHGLKSIPIKRSSSLTFE